MSSSERLEMLEHLSDVMGAIHENTKRLNLLCRTTDEKLIRLHHDAQKAYTALHDRLEYEEVCDCLEKSDPEELSKVLMSDDQTVQELRQERDALISEIEELKGALQVLSSDGKSWDAVIRERDDLQSQIHALHEEIVQRNTLISKLQIENSRIKSENGNLLQELADAIQVDEGFCPLAQ